ncbi:MAG: hypothetical protein WC969_09150 [Elusimicrobiota bacterium]|jgi:hypothetical protein
MRLLSVRPLRILGTAAVLLWTAVCARAQPLFTAEHTTMLSTMTLHAVVQGGPGWRAYVSSDSYSVLSATSADQLHWSDDAGFRLTTGPVVELDASSITALGVMSTTSPVGGLRMYYVGVSTAGYYSILSATSTNGLVWGKENGVRLRRNGGAAYIGALAPLRFSDTVVRLYYIADKNGGNTRDGYRMYSASSTDGGWTFLDEGVVLDTRAWSVSVTSLTDARVRLYFTQPLEALTTAAMVRSAISAAGTSFSEEADLRLTTTPADATLLGAVVVRATETWRWRMFPTFMPDGSTNAFVSSALTLTPLPQSMTPRSALLNQSSQTFTLTGEIFGPVTTLSFYAGSSSMTAFSLSRTDDLTYTGSFDPLGRSNGWWNLVMSDADGYSGTLVHALFIDVPPGEIDILDNVFRPLKGGTAKITVKTFVPGELSVKLYTVTGGLVATLYDGPVPIGNTTMNWPGRTSIGNIVASGVYLLRVVGPKLNSVEKIVVIK